MTLGTILPEAYTGRPVKPRVRLICHGDEDLLLEGVDYTVTYSDNVEKGTGRVTATSLIEELPGTLTGIFTICGAEDIAEETAKLLPEHTLFNGCADAPCEYTEHIFILENLKYFYDCGLELGDESLAMSTPT